MIRVVLTTGSGATFTFEGQTKSEAWRSFSNYVRFMEEDTVESVEVVTQKEFEFKCELTVTRYGFDKEVVEKELEDELGEIGYNIEISSTLY